MEIEMFVIRIFDTHEEREIRMYRWLTSELYQLCRGDL